MTTHVAKQDQAPSVAFLIDADNLPAVEIDDAFEHLKQAGAAVLIRRAYGGIKKGSKPLHELFRKYPSFFKVLPLTGPAKQVRLLKRP